MAEIPGNARFCSDCHAMLKGRLVPHEYLMPAGKPEAAVYRCLLCNTQLQRAGAAAAWEVLPAANGPDPSSKPASR